MRFLDAAALKELLSPVTGGCGHCAGWRAPGWESVTAPVGPPNLESVGTLRNPAEDEPTLEERHTLGTSYWHPQAPVAPSHFPYNRCSVWRCPQCHRGFLQYTEAGGYYVDHRLRELDLALLVA